MATFIQKIKEILILSVFNVLLPSADVYSDFYQSGRLYVGYLYHPNLVWWCPDGDRWDNQIAYACIEARRKHMDFRVIRFPGWAGLLIAPFLINYILCWIAWNRLEKQKGQTWIAPLFGCYPQLIAARTIHLLWTQPSEGMRQKRHLERNLMENEVFTEAVPSALATTVLLVITSLTNPYRSLITGDDSMFLVTFVTSVLSAGLGLAKCLLVGLN